MRRFKIISSTLILLTILFLITDNAGAPTAPARMANLPPAAALAQTPTAPPTPSAPPAPTETPATDTTSAGTAYVVQQGDTLFSIAQAHGVSVVALAAANSITDPARIQAGQTLVIPSPGATIALLPTPAASSTNAAASLPAEMTINGLPASAFILLDESTRQNVLTIYTFGQRRGSNPYAFSKLGDSTIESPHFMDRFDQPGGYVLGDFAYLQPTIDRFQGSFSRQPASVRRGLHSWSVLDPMWANGMGCDPAEHMLACEFRLHRPSFIFIRLGSNDAGIPDSFERNMREIVEFCIANGVIPIIGTKADRHEGGDNINNDILRRIAADYRVPLWDFDLVAATLPGRGLGPDNVHMTTFYAHDWTLPNAFSTGHGVHTLTGLMMLDAVWRAVAAP